MEIRIGLTANDLAERLHSSVSVSGSKGLVVESLPGGRASQRFELPAGVVLKVSSRQNELFLGGAPPPYARTGEAVILSPRGGGSLSIDSLKRPQGKNTLTPSFADRLELSPAGGKVKAVRICDLEDYVRGVLGSEIPGTYHLEAIKAQAVAARTYALRPRISHDGEGFNVCDSYLCCQYLSGVAGGISARHRQAIEETSGEILTYKDSPALALFSSCAGGHTESYEYCFSDPQSGQFPPEPIPYLKGVPEGELPSSFPDEGGLRQLWHTKAPRTFDGWSPHFRWKVVFSHRHLEAHMHNAVHRLMQDSQYEPFIEPPRSGRFGHIERLEIDRRGVSGVAVSVSVHTSQGIWRIKKELVIRSAFANPDLALPRLASARIFFEHRRDRLGLLSELTVFGLGWGHGVGLQQTGAQGMALSGRNYRQILAHYFQNASVTKL